MRKKCIILDFDHTMFNTTSYVACLRTAFAREGVTAEEFDEKRKYLKTCCTLVDMDAFALHISLPDKKKVHDIIHDTIQQTAQKNIFSDVQDFIDRHVDSFDIIVVTQGDEELQTEKIQHSGVENITHVIISHEAKDVVIAPLMKQYDVIHFIDDKPRNLSKVKKTFPTIVTYLITREEDHPYAQDVLEDSHYDFDIADLTCTIT